MIVEIVFFFAACSLLSLSLHACIKPTKRIIFQLFVIIIATIKTIKMMSTFPRWNFSMYATLFLHVLCYIIMCLWIFFGVVDFEQCKEEEEKKLMLAFKANCHPNKSEQWKWTRVMLNYFSENNKSLDPCAYTCVCGYWSWTSQKKTYTHSHIFLSSSRF